MLRFLIAVVCSFWAACSFGQSSPTPSAAGNTAKVVCKSESEEVVLHANASATLPVVDILPCGAEVTVVWKQAGWYRVRTKGGKEGYVKDTFFVIPPPQPVNAQPQDAATMEAQYKTCAKHYIPADKCSPEIYQQLKAKDDAALEQDQYVAPYAKPAPPADADVNLAVRGITMMRDSVLDPTSFTVLQVLVSPKSGGCVHYVASNTFGGRVQQWGIYGLDNKGRLSVSLLSTVLYTQNIVDGCIKTSVRDVTAEVKKALSQGDGR